MERKAYLFDMDGVLVDNCRYHVLSWLELAKRHGGRLTEEQVVAWMGAPGRDYVARMFDGPLPAERVDALIAEKEALYREIYRPHLALREGLAEFLDEASAAGIPCAVATGGSLDNVDFVLDGLGIRRHFRCVVDSSQYGRGKPAPDCYLMAAKRLSAPPSACTVFEDAVNGIEAAKAAGMRVVAITGTNPRATLEKASPDLVVDSFVSFAKHTTSPRGGRGDVSPSHRQ